MLLVEKAKIRPAALVIILRRSSQQTQKSNKWSRHAKWTIPRTYESQRRDFSRQVKKNWIYNKS